MSGKSNKNKETEYIPTEQEVYFTVYSTAQLIHDIHQKAFMIDLMRDPEEAILSRTLRNEKGEIVTEKAYKKWNEDLLSRIISKVAIKTGADPEQIRNPENRTPEIQEEILKAAAAEQEFRRKIFLKSRYFQAIKALDGLNGKFKDENGEGVELETVLYFFAIYDINPVEVLPALNADQIKELQAIFYRIDNFYVNHPLPEGFTAKDTHDLFIKFVEAESQNPQETITRTKIISTKIDEITYPLDKVNTKLWGLTPGEKAVLKAESDKDSRKGKQANINLLIDFDDMDGAKVVTSRPLTLYDKRVFIAAANLIEQGSDIVTTVQIYKAMGNKGRPSAKDRERILKSLEFMSTIKVHIDNTEEAKLYTNYDRVKGSFYLLATEYKTGCEINGAIIEDAIHIISYPFLFDFARKRGQVTTAPIALLESPISMTEANLQLEDYLFRRIAQMKNKEDTTKIILIDTIYKNCNITSKMQRSRLPEKIERILAHYKKIQWIKNYTIDTRSIKIVT